MATWDKGFSRIRQLLKNVGFTALMWLKTRSRYDLLTSAAILIYGAVFSLFTLSRNYRFATFAWDLGIFNQAFHTTLFSGKFLYYTCELYFNLSGSYFASKFSPILLIVLPFYAIYPSPETLLVFKSFLLPLGALPLYLLSTKMIGDKKSGFVIAFAYLLSAGLQSANAFDFQQQIFIPITLFSMYYFMIGKRWKLYFLFVFLSLMIEEHVAVIIFLMALVQLLTKSHLRSMIQAVRSHLSKPSLKTSVLFLTMVLSTSWYFISRFVREAYPIAPEFTELYRATDSFRVLGFTNDILSLPAYILLNPQRTFEALSYDFALKFLYLIFLFAPLLFLSLRSRLSLVAVVLLVPFLLSNYPPYYTLGAHYPLYLVPVIFLAAVEGLSNHTFHAQDDEIGKPKGKLSDKTRNLKATLRNIVIVTLIFSISISPLSPLSEAFSGSIPILRCAQPYPSADRVDALHEIINLVPSTASVLTQNNIFPHFSNRMNAYVIPTVSVASQSANDSLMSYIRHQINLSDYVLLDSVGLGTEEWTGYVLAEVENNTDFATYVIGGSAVLFRKFYDGPCFFIPQNDCEVFNAYSDMMIQNAQLVHDPSSNEGYVTLSQKGTNPGFFAYGPYTFLPPGMFEITFEMKVGEHTEGYLATIDVSENYGKSVLSKRDLYGFETNVNSWTNYTVMLSSTTLKKAVEFRTFTQGSADVYLDRVIVKRVLNETRVDFGTRTYSRQDLLLGSSKLSDEGFIIFDHNLTNAALWYGPYASFPPGNYTVTFYLSMSALFSNSTEKILTADVTENLGQRELAVKDVYASDLQVANPSNWQNFVLEFNVHAKTSSVEFRGLYRSPNVDIRLGFILVNYRG